MEQTHSVSRRSATIQGCSLSPSLFNTVLDVLARAIRHENGIKGTQIKKEVKVPPFGDDMALYIKNTKYSTKKLVELINIFNKCQNTKLTGIKPIAFLSTNDIV